GACLGLDTRICRSLLTPTRVAPSPGLRLLRGSAVALMLALGYRIAHYADGLLFGDRPHESDELTRDGGGNRVRMLAPRQHLPVAPTQAHLRAPGDVANGFRQVLLPGLDLFRHLGPMAIRLGRLDEGPPRMPVAGLRDAAEAAPVGAGILARGEAEILHELRRVLEAREVAQLRDRDDGHGE